MNLTSLTPQQLRHAADLQEKIASLQDELSRYLGASTATTPAASRRKSRMSAAGRAAIIAAQKARWAKVKAGKSSASATTASASKRKMSPAARAKIAAIARARWAKAKASGKKAL